MPDQTPIYNIVTTDGISVAIVLFLFTCFVFPKTIKHRQQFHTAFFVTIGIVLLSTLRMMLYKSVGLYVLLGVLTGFCQIVAMVLLFLSAGGLTIGEFADELRGSYDVIRRGEEEREVIVPLTGEHPIPRDEPVASSTVHVINTPTHPDRSGPVPLE